MKNSNVVKISMKQILEGMEHAKNEGNEEMRRTLQEVWTGRSDHSGSYQIENGNYIFTKAHPIAYYLMKDTVEKEITVDRIAAAFVNAHLQYNHFAKKELGSILRQLRDLELSENPQKEQMKEALLMGLAENEMLASYIKQHGDQLELGSTKKNDVGTIETKGYQKIKDQAA